jgi:hypothetical protein
MYYFNTILMIFLSMRSGLQVDFSSRPQVLLLPTVSTLADEFLVAVNFLPLKKCTAVTRGLVLLPSGNR